MLEGFSELGGIGASRFAIVDRQLQVENAMTVRRNDNNSNKIE